MLDTIYRGVLSFMSAHEAVSHHCILYTKVDSLSLCPYIDNAIGVLSFQSPFLAFISPVCAATEHIHYPKNGME